MRSFVVFAFLLVAAFCVSSQAALYEWGGGGSAAETYWWNDTADEDGDGITANADADHWGVDGFPNLNGTDSAIIGAGGVRKSGMTIDGESSLQVLGAYLYTGGFDVGKVSGGGTVYVENAVLNSQWIGGFDTGTFEIGSGTSWNLRGGGEPLSAQMTGSINFVGDSATLTMPNKSAAYIEGKILLGVLTIDGVALSAVDEAVNGKSFVVDGTTLTLVPEPCSLLLLATGGLLLRRKR